MRAVLMTAVGGPEVLELAELPEPELSGEHDVSVRLPKRLSFVEAAAAPLVTITAREALRERARVGSGQFVLVQAGAGGVGRMAIQIARMAGARVATTVTAGAKTELASSLGAELCIDYRRENVGEKVRAWTEMDGADVVHDTVAGKTFTACFSLVRPYGDLVSNVESPWEDEAITAMRTRVHFTPLKSEPLLRLLIADLVGEATTRESIATLRDDIADLFARLGESDFRVSSAVPNTRKPGRASTAVPGA